MHLADFPLSHENLINKKLEKEMKAGRDLASVILMKRKVAGVKVRIPLKEVSYQGPEQLTKEVQQIVAEEVNVQQLAWDGKQAEYTVTTTDEQLTDHANQDLQLGEAREIVRRIQKERKKLETKLDEKVDVSLEAWPTAHEAYITKNALIKTLTTGTFRVSRLG